MTSYDQNNLPSGPQATATARAKEKPLLPTLGITTDPEREERINRLRERYRSGTYQIDSHSVAARIVDAHLGKSGR